MILTFGCRWSYRVLVIGDHSPVIEPFSYAPERRTHVDLARKLMMTAGLVAAGLTAAVVGAAVTQPASAQPTPVSASGSTSVSVGVIAPATVE
jgi:hypothetical protein